MEVLAENGNKKTKYEISRSRYSRGVGLAFINKIKNIITESNINPEDVGEISLIHGSRELCVTHEKNIGCVQNYPEIKRFLEDLKITHKEEGRSIVIFSSESVAQIYESYVNSRTLGVRDGKAYGKGKFMEDLYILTGYPGCCSVACRKFIDSGKKVSEHPFFEECRERIRELGKSYDTLSIIEIENMIREGDIYPTPLLIRGEMIPCSIECEKAISMCKEWEEFLYNIEDLLLLGGYELVERINKKCALKDAIRIKKVVYNEN